MLLNGQPVNAERGFSLVEVMVALVVTAIGLLGLAKMESLGLASTTVSNWRSLVALEVDGMAAAMHANPGYWSSTSATTLATITGAGPTVTDPQLVASSNCYNVVSSPCASRTMAAANVQGWAQTLNNMVPGYTATIVCTPTATPVTCTIAVTWPESAVAVNVQQTGISQGGFTATQQPTYTLFVQP